MRSNPNNASVAGSDQASSSRTAVPAYSRPRDGRSVQGTATERTAGSVAPPIYLPSYPYYYYDPYYSFYYGYGGYYGSCGYGYYYGSCGYSPYFFPGYGFGLGYMSDPFAYGGGDPYQGGYSASTAYRETGSLRLKIKPNDAQVYIDGYYVGIVDSFDGVFQKLGIDAGLHKIEIRAEGYETAQFEVVVAPGETVTYKGDLKRQ